MKVVINKCYGGFSLSENGKEIKVKIGDIIYCPGSDEGAGIVVSIENEIVKEFIFDDIYWWNKKSKSFYEKYINEGTWEVLT